jgi:MFS family permease
LNARAPVTEDERLSNTGESSMNRPLAISRSIRSWAIALEALVSAAFILIGSKVGDPIGRRGAYVLGLLGYAIGATAMTLAQGLFAIIFSGLARWLVAQDLRILLESHGNLLGLLNSFRMSRLPDVKPSSAAEGMSIG